MIGKLSWRNLWRNKKRTLITMASILFAIVFANFTDALLEGVNKQMTDSMIGVYSGNFQIQHKDFWEDKSLHNTFVPSDTLTGMLDTLSGVRGYAQRLESFALASSNELTKGVMVVGIQPDVEKQITNLKGKIIEGEYFHGRTDDAIIGIGLAEYLEIRPGDTLIMIGEGYHGLSAAGKYHICGTFRLGSPDLDNNLIFLSLPDAQMFFGAYDRVTSVPVFLNDDEATPSVKAGLAEAVPTEFVLQPWQKMMPMVTQSLGLVDAMRVIVLILLYILIGFSILGTIVMMTSERIKEFKVLLAVGMRRVRIAWMVLTESTMMAILGSILGFLASFPVVAYFKYNPIEFKGRAAQGWIQFGIDPVMPTIIDVSIFAKHTVIIWVIAVLLSVYALNKIRQLKVVTAKK